MQENFDKYHYLNIVLGKKLKEMRLANTKLSCNRAEEEYDIGRGNLNKIENGKISPKFTTMWKAAEASGTKLSYVISLVEDEMGDDFKLIDE